MECNKHQYLLDTIDWINNVIKTERYKQHIKSNVILLLKETKEPFTAVSKFKKYTIQIYLTGISFNKLLYNNNITIDNTTDASSEFLIDIAIYYLFDLLRSNIINTIIKGDYNEIQQMPDVH